MAVATDQQILQHRGVVEQLDVLEGARDAAPGDLLSVELRDLLVLEDDAPGRHVVETADKIEESGLAGAVRADDREDLALGDVERDAVDRLEAAELDRDVFEREIGHRPRSDLRYIFWRRKVAGL